MKPVTATILALIFAYLPLSAHAQELNISLGSEKLLSSQAIQLFALISILSVAPGIAIMVTSFPFFVTVFAILRQGIGLQQSPPNMLIVSLALFLTFFVMEPVFHESWRNGISPIINEEIEVSVGFNKSLEPFREFMVERTNSETFLNLSELQSKSEYLSLSKESPLSLLIPSFLLSEVSRAFQIGFLVFIPFLIIDLVVAAVLMSMGMMMVPPATVSLPFKLAFFVVADGWTLISGSLVNTYF